VTWNFTGFSVSRRCTEAVEVFAASVGGGAGIWDEPAPGVAGGALGILYTVISITAVIVIGLILERLGARPFLQGIGLWIVIALRSLEFIRWGWIHL